MRQPPYVGPVSPESLPRGLSLTDFLQTVFVGISGLPGNLVRPKWQPEPPKQPDIFTDWMAFGINGTNPDFSAYVNSLPDGSMGLQRNEDLSIGLSIYGPKAVETYGMIADGFQIPENRIALFQANIGYTDISDGLQVPDLVNQRWVVRVECTVYLKREVRRTYPVLSFVSARGVIYVPDVSPDYQLNWEVPT